MLVRFAELSVLISLILVVVAAQAPSRPFLYSAAALQVTCIGLALAARRSMAHHVAYLTDLSEHDPSTSAFNRRGFARLLTDLTGAEHDVSMLALDIDHFKRINDRYGHPVGDIVLRHVSQILTETTGASGHVARLGGEEFGILLPNADSEEAGVLAEQLVWQLRSLQLPFLHNGEVVTMSIGVATERLRTQRDSAALLARADEALYIAKRGGRDRALLWAPGVRSYATPAASRAITDEQSDNLIRDHSRPAGDRRRQTVDRHVVTQADQHPQ
jgi:diguanylate cyclase (GGDEF)-like protein